MKNPVVAKVTLLVVTTALDLGIATWVYYSWPTQGGSVEVVDNFAEVSALLNQRAEAREPGTTSEQLLPRTEMDEETARAFFPSLRSKMMVYDPITHFRPKPNNTYRPRKPWGRIQVQTNSLGMRNASEPAAIKPDLRVLVTGDSHTFGVTDQPDTFPAILESLLTEGDRTAEVLNSGAGGYNIYHYIGVLERFIDLDPDVFVVVVFGGNDFSGTAQLHRYHQRMRSPEIRPYNARQFLEKFGSGQGIYPQELAQIVYYLNNPDDVALTIDTSNRISDEIVVRCTEVGIRPMFVYIPAPSCGQPHYLEEAVAEYAESLNASRVDFEVSDRIADAWLNHLAEEGVATLDLRPWFRDTEERLYFDSDKHINEMANQRIAEDLRSMIE